MKHILNNISEEEKNAIREQHTGGMKLNTEKFKKLVETKQGDSKPFVAEQIQDRIQRAPSSSSAPKVMKDKMTSSQSDNMEVNTLYTGTSTKDGQTYSLKTGPSVVGNSGNVDVYNSKGQKISDGFMMAVGPQYGIQKGCWGFTNLPDMKKKYGDFKNVTKNKF